MRKRLRLEELKPLHLALGAGGLFLLAVAVTLLVLAASAGRRPADEAAAAARGPAPEPAAERLEIQDFLLEAPAGPPQAQVYLFRQRTPRWSEEQVRRYWVPVKESVLRILRRENDRRTEEMLREVP